MAFLWLVFDEYVLPSKRVCGPIDQRGSHDTRPRMIADDILNQIDSHIRSFPARESHYSRKDSEKHYLSSDLSVSKMHELYLQHEPTVYDELKLGGNLPKIQVSYKFYLNRFNTKFNIAFGRPRTDTCTIIM